MLFKSSPQKYHSTFSVGPLRMCLSISLNPKPSIQPDMNTQIHFKTLANALYIRVYSSKQYVLSIVRLDVYVYTLSLAHKKKMGLLLITRKKSDQHKLKSQERLITRYTKRTIISLRFPIT